MPRTSHETKDYNADTFEVSRAMELGVNAGLQFWVGVLGWVGSSGQAGGHMLVHHLDEKESRSS